MKLYPSKRQEIELKRKEVPLEETKKTFLQGIAIQLKSLFHLSKLSIHPSCLKDKKLTEEEKKRRYLMAKAALATAAVMMSPSSTSTQAFSPNVEVGGTPKATVAFPTTSEVNLLLEERCSHVFPLSNSEYFHENYSISSHMTEEKYQELLNTEAGLYIQKYAKSFIGDSAIMVAMAMQETHFNHEEYLPGGDRYNGRSIGLFQLGDATIENWVTTSVTAFNYQTEEYETVEISPENAQDLEMNCKIACMLMQNGLEKYYGNVYAALYSHNYGNITKKIIAQYAEEQGKTLEEVLSDPTDLGWIENIKKHHTNPQELLPNWKYPTYGDMNYIEHILSYVTKEQLHIYDSPEVYQLKKDLLDNPIFQENTIQPPENRNLLEENSGMKLH